MINYRLLEIINIAAGEYYHKIDFKVNKFMPYR